VQRPNIPATPSFYRYLHIHPTWNTSTPIPHSAQSIKPLHRDQYFHPLGSGSPMSDTRNENLISPDTLLKGCWHILSSLERDEATSESILAILLPHLAQLYLNVSCSCRRFPRLPITCWSAGFGVSLRITPQFRFGYPEYLFLVL
jgi:hypothetical protein